MTAGITTDLEDCGPLGIVGYWRLGTIVHTTVQITKFCSLVLELVASVDCGVLVACVVTKAW